MKTQFQREILFSMLLITLALLLAITAYSQPLRADAGITAGVSTGAVEISDLDNRFTGIIEGENIYGFEAGLFVRPQLGPLYAKPWLLYTFRSGDVTFERPTQTPSVNGDRVVHTRDIDIHKIELPVLFGLHFLGRLISVEAGPVYNYLVEVTRVYDGHEVEINKSGLGYRVGAGVELGKIVLLNLSYSGVVYHSSGDNRATFKEPSKLTFGAGILFHGGANRNSDDD